jgi:hypothetical protein
MREKTLKHKTLPVMGGFDSSIFTHFFFLKTCFQINVTIKLAEAPTAATIAV